jgi:hypothetical protein
MSETPQLDRRRFCCTAAAAAAGSLGLLAFARKVEAMTGTRTAERSPQWEGTPTLADGFFFACGGVGATID